MWGKSWNKSIREGSTNYGVCVKKNQKFKKKTFDVVDIINQHKITQAANLHKSALQKRCLFLRSACLLIIAPFKLYKTHIPELMLELKIFNITVSLKCDFASL